MTSRPVAFADGRFTLRFGASAMAFETCGERAYFNDALFNTMDKEAGASRTGPPDP